MAALNESEFGEVLFHLMTGRIIKGEDGKIVFVPYLGVITREEMQEAIHYMEDFEKEQEKKMAYKELAKELIPALKTNVPLCSSGLFPTDQGKKQDPFIDTHGYAGRAQRYATTPTTADKNSPDRLKHLRWEIYELIESFEGDYGKTISGCLKQRVEDLFKKYTDS